MGSTKIHMPEFSGLRLPIDQQSSQELTETMILHIRSARISCMIPQSRFSQAKKIIGPSSEKESPFRKIKKGIFAALPKGQFSNLEVRPRTFQLSKRLEVDRQKNFTNRVGSSLRFFLFPDFQAYLPSWLLDLFPIMKD
jgi:hypothetical protein